MFVLIHTIHLRNGNHKDHQITTSYRRQKKSNQGNFFPCHNRTLNEETKHETDHETQYGFGPDVKHCFIKENKI